jgi:hypothetical protein
MYVITKHGCALCFLLSLTYKPSYPVLEYVSKIVSFSNSLQSLRFFIRRTRRIILRGFVITPALVELFESFRKYVFSIRKLNHRKMFMRMNGDGSHYHESLNERLEKDIERFCLHYDLRLRSHFQSTKNNQDT